MEEGGPLLVPMTMEKRGGNLDRFSIRTVGLRGLYLWYYPLFVLLFLKVKIFPLSLVLHCRGPCLMSYRTNSPYHSFVRLYKELSAGPTPTQTPVTHTEGTTTPEGRSRVEPVRTPRGPF